MQSNILYKAVKHDGLPLHERSYEFTCKVKAEKFAKFWNCNLYARPNNFCAWMQIKSFQTVTHDTITA